MTISYRKTSKIKYWHILNSTNLKPELKEAICRTVFDFLNKKVSLHSHEPMQGKSCVNIRSFNVWQNQQESMRIDENNRLLYWGEVSI